MAPAWRVTGDGWRVKTGKALVFSATRHSPPATPSGSAGVISRSSGSRIRSKSSKSRGRSAYPDAARSSASDRICPLMSLPLGGRSAFKTPWAAF